MNTQKSIRILEKERDTKKQGKDWETVNYIINCLQEGEKYKKMWEGFKEEYGEYKPTPNCILSKVMDEFEEKYFPKKIKKIVTIKIEATNKENMNSKIESLKRLFETHDEFNWGKTKIIGIKEGD